MAGTPCTICLEDVKSPVSIPCGHLHCERCLIEYVEQHDNVNDAPCPTCRASFCIVTPDLRFVPQKYHKYILPTVRRVYLSQPAAPSAHRLKDTIAALERRLEAAQNSTTTLKMRVAVLDKRVAALVADNDRLARRCDAHAATNQRLADRERTARVELDDLNSVRRKYADLKAKYKALKTAKPASPPPLPTKRTSTQAALDVKTEDTDTDPAHARLILPIPKRPRIALGWRPTVGELKPEPHDNNDDVPVKRETDEDDAFKARLRFPAASMPASRRPVKKDTQAPTETSVPASRRFLSSPGFGFFYGNAASDDEDDDDDEGNEDRHRILPAPAFAPPHPARVRMTGTMTARMNVAVKAEPLRPSGLSRVFQDMEVDPSSPGSSTAPYQSAASSPVRHGAGSSFVSPHAHPMLLRSSGGGSGGMGNGRPTRSGLARGDVFSPRREESGGGQGSIDYRYMDDEERTEVRKEEEEERKEVRVRVKKEEEGEEEEEGRRAYVFRGRRVVQGAGAGAV